MLSQWFGRPFSIQEEKKSQYAFHSGLRGRTKGGYTNQNIAGGSNSTEHMPRENTLYTYLLSSVYTRTASMALQLGLK